MNFEGWMKFPKEELVKYLIGANRDRDNLKKFRESLEYAGKINIGNKNYEVYLREEK